MNPPKLIQYALNDRVTDVCLHKFEQIEFVISWYIYGASNLRSLEAVMSRWNTQWKMNSKQSWKNCQVKSGHILHLKRVDVSTCTTLYSWWLIMSHSLCCFLRYQKLHQSSSLPRKYLICREQINKWVKNWHDFVNKNKKNFKSSGWSNDGRLSNSIQSCDLLL